MKSALVTREEADAVFAVILQQIKGGQQKESPLQLIRTDPLAFLGLYGKVRTQRALEPFQVLPWHLAAIAKTTGRDIALKSRDVGSSTFWVALRVLDVLANPPGDVLIAADREKNATNLIRYAKTLLTGLPLEWRPRIIKDNVGELRFECKDAKGMMQESSIEAIPGSPDSGRSYRCRHLICTEMGFWKKDEDYWNAVSGAVAAEGTVVCESTWPKLGTKTVYGQFWDNPEKGFVHHFVGRYGVPWHTPEWEETRRREMTLGGFPREYPATPDEAIKAPIEAALFQRGWFPIVDAVPADAVKVRYWDMAATLSGDWTAGALLAMRKGAWYLCDMRHMRGDPGDVEALIKQTAVLDGRQMLTYIEQEPGASGLTVIYHYQRVALVGYPVQGDRVTGNKFERMIPLAVAAKAGNVRLLRGPWNAAFLDEAEMVPSGYDDQLDAIAGAMARITEALEAQAPTILVYEDQQMEISPI
ncbi:MAG: hypothetical protein V3V32_04375 [Dehalococcoidia bacterium]